VSQFEASDEGGATKQGGKAISAEGKAATDFAAFTALEIFVDVVGGRELK
jgi:hypothetical protein